MGDPLRIPAVAIDTTRRCNRRFKRGWWCSRARGHEGPCALRPRWWNVPGRWLVRGMK
jgi:hypothetical protein